MDKFININGRWFDRAFIIGVIRRLYRDENYSEDSLVFPSNRQRREDDIGYIELTLAVSGMITERRVPCVGLGVREIDELVEKTVNILNEEEPEPKKVKHLK